ncbi:hypothetical protein [Azospirillum oryzae]|uniref:hypothetical protein n=1 Tax=Azospirillum oryzae TaxID=286727 RepID=UPI00142E0D60|nr:hypothetical protein [Azospirillum oryzae]
MMRKHGRTGLGSAKDQAGHSTLLADQCRETVAMLTLNAVGHRAFPASSLGVRL